MDSTSWKTNLYGEQIFYVIKFAKIKTKKKKRLIANVNRASSANNIIKKELAFHKILSRSQGYSVTCN